MWKENHITNWPHFKERSFCFEDREFVPFEDDFILRRGWETEDTFFSKIVEIQTECKNIKNFFYD